MNSPDRSVRLVSRLACGMVVALAIFACSSREGFHQDDSSFPLPPDGGTSEPVRPDCGLRCSRDLKQVLEGCEGAETVVATCNADQGCGAGKCVDACTAADLSQGSLGCDFWTVYPVNSVPPRGPCFAAMIANTWDRGVSITAEYGSSALDISKSVYVIDRKNEKPTYALLEGPLAPGQVAVLFFSHDEEERGQNMVRCPADVTPALLVHPTRSGTTRTKAFRIKTDAPVAAYSVAPYGGFESFTPTATLLLPVSSWTKSYIAVSPSHFEEATTRRSLQIIANEDDTEVSIRPTADISGSAGVDGAAAGVAQTWTLAKGEVLQFSQSSLTGSPIEADKPVGVFGGSECTFLPGPKGWCDMLQQQIPPLSQWGIEYAAVPFKPRLASTSPDARELVPYTIVGGADGTILTYEPSRPRGAPEALDAGQSADFLTDQLFVVKSQDSKHPFHVNVYMTSSQFGGGIPDNITLGDPDYVNVPATDPYLDRYVFLTDFTFPDTTLTFVRKKTPNGFMPVELECAGEVTDFKPLGSSGQYEYAWVQLTSGFVAQKSAKGECGYGRQEARSNGPFAVTVWGVGPDSSYGYVGGTGLRPVNDAPPPIVK